MHRPETMHGFLFCLHSSSATATRTSAATGATESVESWAHFSASLAIAHQFQTIAQMEHHVAVNGVGVGVAAHGGTDVSTDI